MRIAASVVGFALMAWGTAARAEPAVIGVDVPERAERRDRDDDGPAIARAVSRDDACVDRCEGSLVRASLGGAVAAVDRGAAGSSRLAGLDLGVDVGRGPIAVRLGAAWLRADGQSAGLAQYGAEVVVDAIPRGPFHPIAALGIALAHTAGSDAGVGTLRLGVAYSLPVREVDLRVAIAALGALPGPTDGDAGDLRAYAMGVASLCIGF